MCSHENRLIEAALMRTHNIPFRKKTRKLLYYPKSELWDFSKGLKNVFETAMVNDPSAFELLKFYCILKSGSPFSFVDKLWFDMHV